MTPNEGLVNEVDGFNKFGWLNTLKNSARNWKLFLSLILKFLDNETSKSTNPGPTMDPRFSFPNCPVAGIENAAVLNHFAIVGLDDTVLPLSFGRSARPPVCELSRPEIVAVKAKPV
jgi:hypothetical protein